MMSCHVAFEMLESSLSLYFVVKYTLVNVMIVESSLGRGSNSIPALLFADCVVSLCFYLII